MQRITQILAKQRGVLFYDDVCNLCLFWVRFLKKCDKKQQIEFLSLNKYSQIEDVQQKFNLPKDLSTVVFVNQQQKNFQKSDAIIQVLYELPYPYRILSGIRIIPKFIRDPVYSFIGRNRYSVFGKKEDACSTGSCRIPNRNKN
ncbi:hypothetical protein PPERSA_04985 [Pseudocohnilembus persalinus]|uniref:DUF393 domain-containing protein n=1 Tax=Pseudocohnilembus persalinus TaxID=266149 RepID=A0A0V0QVZ5_PSEPJ|nr:hypothetical protein PPERSA_04985 [Pseudocohnilembus persalinus]|eukprot:KRX06372.1 hypothetical protein PPERSA_04985 [Pseudocohnilembus persalinus]